MRVHDVVLTFFLLFIHIFSLLFLNYFKIIIFLVVYKRMCILKKKNLFPIAFLVCFLIREFEGLLLDYSRQRATVETMDKLLNLAKVRMRGIY